MYRLGSVPDGSIIRFPNSTRYFMKVCDANGVGGVVTLDTGRYVKASDLFDLGLSADRVEIIAERDVWGIHYDVEG